MQNIIQNNLLKLVEVMVHIPPRFILAITCAGILLIIPGLGQTQISQGNAAVLALVNTLDNPLYLPIAYNAHGEPKIAGCSIFPYDNIWNTPVDSLPVAANSAAYITAIGAGKHFHADFGQGEWDGGPIGIPFVVVPPSQLDVPIHFTESADESEPGPYPIPANAPIEGGPASGGDRHVLVLESGSCTLYELYSAYPQPNGSWNAGSGAVFALNANGPLRPIEWTSADAAGLPILPGLARYDEVAGGEIRHALRFTVQCTQDDYIWPARHRAGSCNDPSHPKMGQRFRLKADYDIEAPGIPDQVKVILRAMKKYGLILADNGSSWYISGTPDERWDNEQLHWLDENLTGAWMEAVDTSALMIDPNSGQGRQP
jgi:hypothetical protein